MSLRPLVPRDPAEPHRVASPLELFTDLCYVVGISQAAERLHHYVGEGHVGRGVLFFLIAFFAIWWAWLNFAWFNSAYDNDDTVSRLLALLQVFGSLVVAAGVPRIFEEDFRIGVIGYLVMRVGLILLWLRAAAGHPERRTTALRYVVGLTAVQVLWVAFLAVPHDARPYLFVVLAALDVGVPYWAERTGATPWHPHHIAERYGLFFIIVLGETVLSVTVAIQGGVDAGHARVDLASVVVGGVLVIFSAWWLYFARESAGQLVGDGYEFVWGFGHYLIYAPIAAVGAGLALRVEVYLDHAEVSGRTSAALVTVPVAVFLVMLWAVVVGMHDNSARTIVPFVVAVVVVLLGTFTPRPELVAGAAMAVLLALELRLTTGAADVGAPA